MAIVIDNGSACMKVGIAGNTEPICVFPTAVAGDVVGVEAMAKGEDNVTFPLQAGEIRDINAMEKVWKYAFDKVGGIQNRPVLLTEPSLNNNKNREKMCKVMFEKFKVPALYIAKQELLSCYASGRQSGLVVEIGENQTQCVPIIADCVLKEAVVTSHRCAAKATGMMRDRLGLDSNAEARRAKEELCYLVADPKAELKKDEASLEKAFKLKNGTEVKLGADRIRIPEELFFGEGGLAKLVQECILKCDVDKRNSLSSNIVLSGETSIMFGLDLRMKAAIPGDYKVVGAGKYRTWIGGSILGSLDQFKPMLVTQKEWEKNGMAAVLQKVY